jgi:hypothetical protein
MKMAMPPRLFAGAAVAGLVLAVAVGITYTGHSYRPARVPRGTSSPVTPAMSNTESAQASFGQWQPSLDLTEKLVTSGAAAMHEQLGSAADGVVAFKDYGWSANDPTPYHITIYRSADGITWQPSEVPNPINAQDGDAACHGLYCVVLVGGMGAVQNVLEVTSDLQHWTTVAVPLGLLDINVLAVPTGFVIQGSGTTSGWHMLMSSDGLTWTEVPSGGRAISATDPECGWLAERLPSGATVTSQSLWSISTDGLTWRDIQDPDHLDSTTDQIGWTTTCFGGRWYMYAQYRQMPAGYQQGGMGLPLSTATPVASWQTIYWIDEASLTIRSSGKTSAQLPDQAVSANGVLVGVEANDDFTAEMLISTDGLSWTDAGLMPPGVPRPSYLHGIPIMYRPTIARAGSSVIAWGDPAVEDANVWGAEIYVAHVGG